MNSDKWVKDKHGNKASIEYFGSKEKALEALESLKNCKDCVNCKDCTGCCRCFECYNCSMCSFCRKCNKCLQCFKLLGSHECVDCSFCFLCLFCFKCYECSECSYCLKCSWGSKCHSCVEVHSCEMKSALKFNTASLKYSYAPKIPSIENLNLRLLRIAQNNYKKDLVNCFEPTTYFQDWVIEASGDEGKRLEDFYGTDLAAILIYLKNSVIPFNSIWIYANYLEIISDLKVNADLEELKKVSNDY